MLTHNHWCKYCDRIGSHQDANCDLPYEISKIHECKEHKAARKRFFALMNRTKCKYGCVNPCNHPTKRDDKLAEDDLETVKEGILS